PPGRAGTDHLALGNRVAVHPGPLPDDEAVAGQDGGGLADAVLGHHGHVREPAGEQPPAAEPEPEAERDDQHHDEQPRAEQPAAEERLAADVVAPAAVLAVHDERVGILVPAAVERTSPPP